MKAAFITLGCKVNQYETEAMRLILQQNGADDTDVSIRDADAIIVNSCTVTAESDRKLRQLLRRCRRQNPSAVLVLTGCMPQAFPEKTTALDADIILGNASRRALPEAIADFRKNGKTVAIPPHSKEYEPLTIREMEGHTRAFVKIQDGCNRFCTYCIIPYARGRVRSRAVADIQEELTALAARGYREVVLVGINLSAYGQDNGTDLADAVDAACAVDGIERVRLGSLEPDFMTDEILRRLSSQPKLCPQFHIALQSGCDATLKRMNRHYTTADYAALCAKLRERFPGCALTTDVMVGFPGETEADFAASLSFTESIGFSRVHVFPYSRRPGTVADKMPDQVPEEEKNDRSHRMIEACRHSADAYAGGYIGKTVTILTETRRADGLTEGLTDTYLTVAAKTAQPAGKMISVRIISYQGGILIGEETVLKE